MPFSVTALIVSRNAEYCLNGVSPWSVWTKRVLLVADVCFLDYISLDAFPQSSEVQRENHLMRFETCLFVDFISSCPESDCVLI